MYRSHPFHFLTYIVIAVSALLLILAAVSAGHSVLGARVIGQAQYDALRESREEVSFDPTTLSFSHMQTAYDAASNTVFISQSLNKDDWEGSLICSGADSTLYLLEDSALHGKEAAIADGHIFHLLIADGKSYAEVNMAVSGLPIICIDYDYDENADYTEDHMARFRLIDAGVTSRNKDSLDLYCQFHWRGATAMEWDKKSYRISLCDESGKSVKRNLLNMRKDEDWILNAMYTDSSKVREKAVYQFWNAAQNLEENPMPSADMEYVELFVNNEYEGLYGLMTRVDRKTMELNSHDLVYKIDSDDFISDDDLKAADAAGAKVITDDTGEKLAEIRYPKNNPMTWKPFMYFQSFVEGERSLQDLEKMGYNIDLDSLADYQLFLLYTMTVDNDWKNNLIIIKNREKTKAAVSFNAWDLDYTLGDVWTDENSFSKKFSEESAGITDEEYYMPESASFMAALEDDPQEMEGILEAKAGLWQKNGLNADYLCGLIEKANAQITSSGALQRDAQRWPEVGDCEDISSLEQWVRTRFAAINQLAAENKLTESLDQ